MAVTWKKIAYETDVTTHAALTATHGVSGAIVGTTDTQELTNKTLNASVGKGTWTASGTWTLPAFTAGGDIIGQATYDLGSAASPFAEAYIGNTNDYLKVAIVGNVPTIYGTGAYVRIGDKATANYLSSEDDLLVTGNLEVDGGAFFDGTVAFESLVYMADDSGFCWGSSYDSYAIYETADANANLLTWALPIGGSTNVPVMQLAESQVAETDMGIHDGVTQPTLSVIEKSGKYTSSSTGTCDGVDLDELTETNKFASCVVGDIVRIYSGTNVTAGWYWITTVTDISNIDLDRDFSSGASTNITYAIWHDFTMLSADGVCTRITDGAPSDSSVEIDRDGWLILDVGQANGRLYWRANNGWHYVDATA